MARKLASIQKIIALEPIEGADAIEKATVLGWQLVVKKGEYKVGDLCVYCEIDTLLPSKPEFEFMRPRAMRVRTIRLRGQISQGICFPLSMLPQNFEIVEDQDCTLALEIEKYEAPIPASLAGKVKGGFPTFLLKTDETRVQVLQPLLDKFKDQIFYITEKLDGSSCTYYMRDGQFGVCSRNLELLEDDENSLWKVARQLDIENKLLALDGNFALQGELVGEGIQSNKYKIKGQSFRVYNIFEIDKFQYLNYTSFVAMAAQLGLITVPVLSTNYVLQADIPTLIKMATIKSTLATEAWAEGIVLRPLQELKDFQNSNLYAGRVSFKAINPEFLLKYGE